MKAKALGESVSKNGAEARAIRQPVALKPDAATLSVVSQVVSQAIVQAITSDALKIALSVACEHLKLEGNWSVHLLGLEHTVSEDSQQTVRITGAELVPVK